MCRLLFILFYSSIESVYCIQNIENERFGLCFFVCMPWPIVSLDFVFNLNFRVYPFILCLFIFELHWLFFHSFVIWLWLELSSFHGGEWLQKLVRSIDKIECDRCAWIYDNILRLPFFIFHAFANVCIRLIIKTQRHVFYASQWRIRW